MAIKVKGLNKLAKDLKKFGKDGEGVVISEIGIFAKRIELGAKGKLPFELNFIAQKINTEFSNRGLTAVVGVEGTDENPVPVYHEFGTGLYASQLLSGNEYDDKIRALAWTYKKDLDGTLPATPYLFPTFFEERPVFIAALEKKLKELANKV